MESGNRTELTVEEAALVALAEELIAAHPGCGEVIKTDYGRGRAVQFVGDVLLPLFRSGGPRFRVGPDGEPVLTGVVDSAYVATPEFVRAAFKAWGRGDPQPALH